MTLHFHDSRGGQAFSSDESGESVKEFISAVFAAKKSKAVFFDDSKQLSTEKLS